MFPPLKSLARAVQLVALCLTAQTAAADLRVITATPVVSFTERIPVLTQRVVTTLDSDLFSVDLRTSHCAQASRNSVVSPMSTPDLCETTAQHLGTREMGMTLKVPQLSPAAPYVDITLRPWHMAQGIAESANGGRGAAIETEITQIIGPFAVNAGYSRPFSGGTAIAWTAQWIGASARWTSATQVRLSFGRSREQIVGQQESTFTFEIARNIMDTARVSGFITHVAYSSIPSWRAGIGIECSF